MNGKAWMAAAALVAAGAAQATCYSVHKADGKLILETSTTPVDLTLPLGDTVPAQFGQGAFMTMSDLGVFCKDSHATQAPQKVVAVAAPIKNGASVQPPAPVEEASDEELLALKPEGVAATAPVQPSGANTELSARRKFEAGVEKGTDEAGAREAARKVAARRS